MAEPEAPRGYLISLLPFRYSTCCYCHLCCFVAPLAAILLKYSCSTSLFHLLNISLPPSVPAAIAPVIIAISAAAFLAQPAR